MAERRENDGTMERILKSVAWQVEHFAELPVLVVACLRGRKVPYLPMPAFAESSYYGSIYPSVQNLLLAARAMGLRTSLITLPLWSVTAARSILGLPLSVQPCSSCPSDGPRGVTGRPPASRPARSSTSTGTGTSPGVDHLRPGPQAHIAAGGGPGGR